MSPANGGAKSGTLGKKNLSTIHAVAQALAIGPNVDNGASHAARHHGVPPLDETLGFEPAP
jgi:hypothetical protein